MLRNQAISTTFAWQYVDGEKNVSKMIKVKIDELGQLGMVIEIHLEFLMLNLS